MYDETINDDIRFDRLVDGELSADERRQLLESLDVRPDGWRRCALAFLEAQSWRAGLGEVVRPTTAKSNIVKPTVTSISNSAQPSFGTSVRWFALAAAVLFAFTLGLLQRERMAPVAGGASQTGEQLAVVEPPAAAPAQPRETKVDDAITLFVRDDQGQTRTLRVPLVDADRLDQKLGTRFQSGVPAQFRDRLQDRGYHVQSKQRYAPLWLENGRPMFVPVEDTKIVPVSQNVY